MEQNHDLLCLGLLLGLSNILIGVQNWTCKCGNSMFSDLLSKLVSQTASVFAHDLMGHLDNNNIDIKATYSLSPL